jgi:hypothetical protein
MAQGIGGKIPLQNIRNVDLQPTPSEVAASSQEISDKLSVLTSLIDAKANIFDVESQGVSKNMIKLKEKQSEFQSQSPGKTLSGSHVDELIEMILGMMTADTLKKKKKQEKSAFDDLLEELSGLEGLIDKNHLDENEKQELEKLFQNLDRIKQLKQRLRNVEDREEQFEKQLQAQNPSLKPNMKDLEITPELEEPDLNTLLQLKKRPR